MNHSIEKSWVQQIAERQQAREHATANFWQYANLDISVNTINEIKGHSKLAGNLELTEKIFDCIKRNEDFALRSSMNQTMFFISQKFMIFFCPGKPKENYVKEMKGREFDNFMKLAAIGNYEFIPIKKLLSNKNYIALKQGCEQQKTPSIQRG